MDTASVWKVWESTAIIWNITLIFCYREFPFEQLLVFWDSLFAKDPDFCLVDYICVAMLLRIRWERMYI